MKTQHELIIEYIKEFGSIVPAKMYGEIYKGQMCGSEFSRRARELRKKGVLFSQKEGKFERFFANRSHKIFNTETATPEIMKVVAKPTTQPLFQVVPKEKSINWAQ
jgi:SET domain-containing protein